MIRNRMRRDWSGDEGIAMIFVIAVGLVVTILVVAMFGTVLQNSTNSRTHRNVTSAQAAAEAGISDAFFKLSQNDPGTGKTYWSELAGCPQSLPCTQSVGPNATYKMWVTNEVVGGNPTGHLIIWSQGTFGTNTRTVRETVAQSYPPAFDYSMFASKGIDIHHHGSSYLSPQVQTTAIHSNGYIKLDYSSEYTVNTIEAVGNIKFAAGGGATPQGNISPTGYQWYDPLNGRCYPGAYAQTGGACDPSQKYSGNSLVTGTVEAGSVTFSSRGEIDKLTTTIPMSNGAPDITGGPYNGGVLTGSFRDASGTTWTTTSPTPVAANCPNFCNKGNPPNNATFWGGNVSGNVMLQSGYAPPVVPFPSIDYSTIYRPISTTYSSSTAFLTYLDKTVSNYRCFQSATSDVLGTCSAGQWPNAIEPPAGYYDITSGSLSLNYGSIQKDVQSALGASTAGPAPIIIIRGGIIVENGGITLNAGLVLDGQDNSDQVLIHAQGKDPVTVNVANLTGSGSQPGVLMAGGTINSTDYDTDSSWTATCNCYEPNKATPIYIRGLVYSASWDGTESVPQNQHWHNYDPKNLMKIYGAQVGADLHDCNNFTFTYDPIVRNAFGFGGGSVKVVDYQELGT